MEKKKKILVFTDCYIYGGSERLMSFLLNNKKLKENYEIKLSYRKYAAYEKDMQNDYAMTPSTDLLPQFLLSNETLFYRINSLHLPKIIKIIIKLPFFIFQKFQIYSIYNLIVFSFLLKKQRPTILHINNGGYPGAKSCNVLVAANFLTIQAKIVYQVNNQAQSCDGYLERIYDKFINKNVHFFINASQRAKQQLIEKRDFNQDKILLINNCVTLPIIKHSREQILRELNIPADSFLIVEVAFLSERKGQRFLIAALADLYKKENFSRQKVYCALVGNGEDEEFLKRYIDELGLNSNVFLLGYKNNSEDFISACDLFVLPSIKDEDMPLVLLSALGYGKPIISTNFAGIAQVIRTNSNGILIKNDLNTFTYNLSSEILRLINNEKLRLELGYNAQKSYMDYNPENYGLKLKDVYEQIYE
ncbi:glycosyltransferase [Flavobacterium sp. N1736]|uniref:glycosyltransferase n=1 Tax=Flavobacterium sp. N1736 TaxID=2986823 RepID=UPI0022246EA6|nr:glycosyltransferase [Flavobacterium sp. N1736]